MTRRWHVLGILLVTMWAIYALSVLFVAFVVVFKVAESVIGWVTR